jgi:Ca2+-binding EF-hand superfamily protein
MGGCLSNVAFVVHSGVPGQDEISKEVFNKLHLTDLEINSFYVRFLEINKTGTPYVYRAEITAYFKIEEGDLTNKIFDLFAKRSGKLDFCQFLCTMWNFLSLEADDLSTYAFVLFDHDNSGSLSYDEIVQLIETIHRKKYAENSGVQSLCDEIRLISTKISLKQFRKFAKLHPGLCGPLASMQFMMQKTMLGDTFWTRLQIRRGRHAEQSDSRYLMKLLAYTRERYSALDLKHKIEKMDGERQSKINELKSSRRSRVQERERNDQMLDYFQLNPSKKKRTRARSPRKRAGMGLLRKSSKIEVWKDEESEEDDEEEGVEGERDDPQEEEEEEQGKQTERENGTDDHTKREKVEQGSPSPPPQPLMISSTSLRRTLLIKQNSAPDPSDSKPKTLFHPSSVPRKSMINGVMKVLPPASDSTAPLSPSSASSLPSPSAAPQPEVVLKPRQSIAAVANPLPSISNSATSARKTLVHSGSLPNNRATLIVPQRRVTKLEPIKR